MADAPPDARIELRDTAPDDLEALMGLWNDAPAARPADLPPGESYWERRRSAP